MKFLSCTLSLLSSHSVPIAPVALSEADVSFLSSHVGGKLGAALTDSLRVCVVKGDASVHVLQQMETSVKDTQADQKYISNQINVEEKKQYGTAVEDPKDFISNLLSGGGDEATTSSSS